MQESIPRITGTLRAHTIEMPEVIREASGIIVLGRKIRSLIFSTDIAIIRNCDADAVLAVYPFSSIPVFVGVGGGITKGLRSVYMAQDAEAQGAFGVVVNNPMSNSNIRFIKRVIDIPVVSTVIDSTGIQERLDAGVTILNVAAGKNTADVVREIRKDFPKVPIIASGGKTDESIRRTIEAGANAIVYTPISSSAIFSSMMDEYRTEKNRNPELTFKTLDSKKDELVDLIGLLHQQTGVFQPVHQGGTFFLLAAGGLFFPPQRPQYQFCHWVAPLSAVSISGYLDNYSNLTRKPIHQHPFPAPHRHTFHPTRHTTLRQRGSCRPRLIRRSDSSPASPHPGQRLRQRR